jgi:hypothetical protein
MGQNVKRADWNLNTQLALSAELVHQLGTDAKLQEMRRLDSETDNFKRREEAAAHARAEILRLAQGQRTTLATETADEMIRAIKVWRDTPSNRNLE